MNQCYAVLLAVCLVMGSISPALAVEKVGLPEEKSQQPERKECFPRNSQMFLKRLPAFKLNLEEENGATCLYGTLSYMPKNTVKILVLYSFGSEQYTVVANTDNYGSREWDLSGLEGGTASLTQRCRGEMTAP